MEIEESRSESEERRDVTDALRAAAEEDAVCAIFAGCGCELGGF
jgi:hypothetical protein